MQPALRPLYREIYQCFHDRGTPPTVRELCARLGLSPNAVQQQLVRLRQGGYIEENPHSPGRCARTIMLTGLRQLRPHLMTPTG